MIVYAQVTIDIDKMHLYTWLCIANVRIFIFFAYYMFGIP